MILVFILDMRTLPLKEDYERVMSLIPKEDRKRAERFKIEDDRIRSAVGTLMLRYETENLLLKKGRKLSYNIIREKFKKPYLKEYDDINFSLSHSGSLIALAFGERPLGVDVEIIKDGIKAEGFKRHLSLSDDEMDLIEGAIDPAKEFFKIWTLREAFSKLDGRGLPLYFDGKEDITFSYEKNEILFNGKKYKWEWFYFDQHVTALCKENLEEETRVHKIKKSDWENILNDIYKGLKEGIENDRI